MPQLDISTFLPQLFWLIVSFFLLYYILSKFFLPKVINILHERDKKMLHALSRAEKNKKEAFRLKEDYEEIIARAMKTKSDMLLEASKEISKSTDHKMTEYELGMKIVVSESEQKIKEYKKSSSEDVKQIAAEAAEDILSSLFNVKATKAEILKRIESKGSHSA